MSCKKSNIKDTDPIVLPSSVKEAKSVDDLLNILIDRFKDDFTSFSLSKDTSLQPDSFKDSMVKFIGKVLTELGSTEMETQGFDLTLGGQQSELVRKGLEIEFFPKLGIQRESEEPLEALIGTTENAQERHRMKLGRALSTFFLNNRQAEKFFRDQIRDEIALRTVIDTEAEKDQIVDTVEGLNEHIKNLQKDKFRIILKYLKALGISDLAGYMYNGNKLVDKYQSTLDKMYQVIEYKRRVGTLQGDIEEDWINQSLNPDYEMGEVPSFFEAMNAYLTLVYFDDLIKDSIGDYISANKQDDIIEVEDGETIYKYHFGKDTENRVQGWEVDVRDALREMGNFSKFLIQLIPIKDTKLTPVNFLNTFTSLFNIVSKFPTNSNMYKLLVSYSDNPTENLKTILHNIHDAYQQHLEEGNTDNVKTGLYGQLSSFGINDFDFQVLDAVYDYVFARPNSLYKIEQKYNRKHGITNRYSLVDSLSAQVLSSTTMNYLETTVKDDELVTRIKRKYSSKRELFDHLNSVNRNNVSTDSDFPYTFTSNIDEAQSIYTIDINGTTVRVTVQTRINGMQALASNKYGLLSKAAEDQNITIEVKGKDEPQFYNLGSFLNKFDVSTYKRRKAIFDNQEGANVDFMNVLRFIDDLAGTHFTIDDNGLLEYFLFKSKYPTGVANALATATRGLVVNDIHKKFEKELENPGTMYSRTDLARFIADKNLYPVFKISDISQNDYSWKEIWKLSELGNTLVTLTSGQNWLQNYIDVQHVMSGEISTANTKNLLGDSLPNYGLAFMGSNLQTLLQDAQHAPYITDGQPLNRNIFAEDPTAVIDTVIDTDVRLPNGTIKQVKSMEEGELYYHAIMNKFILPLIEDSPYMIIQPTTYSDKTKFINYRVKTKINGLDLIEAELSDIESRYASEMGYAYGAILKNVLGDYAKIFTDLQPLYNQAYVVDPSTKLITYNKDNIKQLVKQVDKKLRQLSEKAISEGKDPEKVLISLAKEVKVDIYLDTHFRPNSPKGPDGKSHKFLAFNESLAHYALELYTPKELRKRLMTEKVKFLTDLMKTGFKFEKVKLNAYGQIKDDTPTGRAFSKITYSGRWATSDGNIILAKDSEGNAITKVQDINLNMQLNPLLERYFLVNSYLNNSMRMLLTGSEINHKNKQLIGTNLGKEIRIKMNNDLAVNTEIIPVAKQMAKERGINPDYFFESMSFSDLEELISRVPKYARELEEVRQQQLYYVESAGQGAQLKRNVIIPATMRYYMQGTIRGIGTHMKVAVMDDIRAAVFNFTGETDGIDAHDGSAWINPITSILENWSLQENEVGTIKKPIWHYYDGEHMTASLVKFAAHTMTNTLMRQSEGSPVSMRKMFMKMTNQSWTKIINDTLYEQTDYDRDEKGNLILDINGQPTKSSFKKFDGNIFALARHTSDKAVKFSTITDGNEMLYYMGAEGDHYAITDAGFETVQEGSNVRPRSAYYTMEGAVTESGEAPEIQQKVYHYFDMQGNHYREDHILSAFEELDRGLHTVNNIYELHEMFGGIDSESITEVVDSTGKSKKELRASEASNYVVANIINNVTIRKVGLTKNAAFNQDNYIQPLKSLMIDYLCNNSAIKNGAGNRNSSERFYNDEGLDYITMDTRYYGIQMDADHEADEAEMTEFSQVISALDAGGRLHGYVSGIYKALGQIALAEAKIEMEAIEAYQQNPNAQTRDALYDIIGKTILDNIKMGSGKSGLAEAILGQIKAKFNLTSTHDRDLFKIPFSDDNIYSSILSTYASVITRKSIRKKYPGLGAVISPGYDVATIYEIGGRTYQYDDIKRQALETYKEYAYLQLAVEETEDEEEKKEAIEEVLAHPYHQYFEQLYLDSTNRLDAHTFNSRVVKAFLQKATDDYNKDKYYYNIPNEPGKLPDFKYYLETFMPTDNIGIRYRDAQGKEHWLDITLNKIEDYYNFKANPRAYVQKKLGVINPVIIVGFRKNLHIARNLAPTKIWWEWTDEQGRQRVTNIFDTDECVEAFKNNKNPKTQQLLDQLDKGKWTVGGKTYDIILHNMPAELIMSNIYQSKFGINQHMSLAEILNMSKSFFASKDRQVRSKTIRQDFYDLIMQKANGFHTYISLDRDLSSSSIEGTEYKTSSWRKLHRETNHRRANDIVVNDVFAMDDDGRKLFQVGRDIVRKDLVYDSVDKVYKQGDKVVEGRFSVNPAGEVIEYIEFVTKHRVTQDSKGKHIRHTVLNIDTKEMQRAMQSFKETEQQKAADIDKGITTLTRKIIRDIYQADSYELMTLNNDRVSVSRTRRLKNVMEKMANEFLYDPELSSYLTNLYDGIIKQIPETSGGKITISDNFKMVQEGDALIFKNGGLKNLQASYTGEYVNKLSKKRRASFMRSTGFTASRIPAQTLQSFMNMMLVGFSGEGSNQAYVSHWQTWLQGSDYDIDKAYIMGLAFDDNGSYIGWSSLFDYTSIETIKASEYLSMPNPDVVITRTSDPKEGLDITTQVQQLHEIEDRLKIHKYENEQQEINDRVHKINLYVDILNKLGDNTKIYCKDNYIENVRKVLNMHHNVQIPVGVRPMALRNFVSSHIQNTIQHVRNAADSYIPVKTKDMGDAADNSPKGKEALGITLLNPLAVYKMQYQNMTGKNVIAISATGQKAMFMWNFYVNDVIKNAREGVDYTVENGELVVKPHSDLEFARFEFNTKRIIGRSSDDFKPVDTSIRMLPDINIEGIEAIFDETDTPEKRKERVAAVETFINNLIKNKLNPRIKTDNINSQMISAATDNAKELILPKINAGSKLAKCYLYLMSLGFDINDIVAFMTSDAVDLIDRLSNPNIFTGNDAKPAKIIGDLKEYLTKLRESIVQQNKELAPNKETIIGQALPDNMSLAYINNMLADINEFEKVFEGSNEFSNFGRMLSINQGLLGKTEDLESTLQRFRSNIEQREKAVKLVNQDGIFNLDAFINRVGSKNAAKYMLIANGNFDPVKWLQDATVILPKVDDTGKIITDDAGNPVPGEEYSYRRLTSEYYNYIKHSINIFAAADYIPHFSSMFKLLGSECTVNAFSTKSRILQSALKKIRAENPNMYIDSDYYSSILKFASKLIITKFITEQESFKLPINKGARLFNSNRQLVRQTDSGTLDINSEESIASFKYYFENVVIPGLQNGNLFQDRAINIQLRNNEFIQSLTRDMDGDVPIWKTNINMSADSAYTTIQLAKYSKALGQLSNIEFGSHNLADWFALYNLVVNNNSYGSDRLTKAFENFINEFDRGGNSLINRYLKYIGEMDHKGEDVDELFNFTARDLFLAQARPVSHLEGQTAPVVIMIKDGVPKYYMRKGYRYVEIPSMLPTVSGETNLDRLSRFAAQRSYFLLGNPYSTYLTQIKMLLNADNPAAVLSELMRTSTIQFKINCV